MKRGYAEAVEFSYETLREFLRYDPSTGYFFWRVTRNHLAKEGQRAGHKNPTDGRWYICFCGKRRSASRLAWFYTKGEWPSHDLDHRDGDKTNNSWCNLRPATVTQNMANSRPRTMLKGVTRVPSGKYMAQIQKDGIKLRLGTFTTPEEAHKAYARQAKILYGEFARTQ